jgi:transcriptional regulator with XRE-family HTH domain
MGIEEGLRSLRLKKGLSLRKLAELTQISRVTLHDIERGRLKQGPRLDTLITIGERAGYDMHELAHHAFDLPPPERLGELSGDLKRLCDLVMGLSEEERRRLLDKIEGWIEGMRDAGGGGVEGRSLDAQAGYG